jgi:hypothetical protein
MVYLLKKIEVFSLFNFWLEVLSYIFSNLVDLYHSTEFVLQNNKLSSEKKKNDLGLGLFWMLALSIWSTPFPYGRELNALAQIRKKWGDRGVLAELPALELSFPLAGHLQQLHKRTC